MTRTTPWRHAARVLACCVASLAAVQATSADEAAPRLGDAVERALATNPGLTALGYQVDLRRGLAIQAGLKPNPELDLLVENAFGTGAFEGVDAAQTTLSVGWLLERHRREGRIAAAGAGVALAEAEVDVQRLDVAADTALIFLDSLLLQERHARLQEAVALAQAAVDAVRERVQVGRTPRADLARAEADLARARLDVDDARHELATSLRRLAAQWGETGPALSRVQGDLLQLPPAGEFESLLAALDDNPAVRRYLTEDRLREAELRLAQAEARPSWRVNVGLRRLEFENDVALLAGFTRPLGVSNRNQGRIAAARAAQAMNRAELDALRVRAEADLFGLHQELQHDIEQANTLRDEIVPRLETALADTREAYALGRYAWFELRLVRAELLDARLALLEASADAHRNRIEIERLTGAALHPAAARRGQQ